MSKENNNSYPQEKNAVEQKRRQLSFHNWYYAGYRAIEPSLASNPVHMFISQFLLRKMVEAYRNKLAGKRMVSVCCGDGFEAEYFARLGAEIVALDISSEATKVTKRKLALHPSSSDVIVGDAEHLPFKSKSFDCGLVFDGLHHLCHPVIGIYELNRVTREVFMIREPHWSFVMKILVYLGLADRYEPSGNFVHRFHEVFLSKLFRDLELNFQIQTYFCQNIVFFKKYVYPIFRNKILFRLFVFVFLSFNKIFGRWGNALIATVWEQSDATERMKKSKRSTRKRMKLGGG